MLNVNFRPPSNFSQSFPLLFESFSVEKMSVNSRKKEKQKDVKKGKKLHFLSVFGFEHVVVYFSVCHRTINVVEVTFVPWHCWLRPVDFKRFLLIVLNRYFNTLT